MDNIELFALHSMRILARLYLSFPRRTAMSFYEIVHDTAPDHDLPNSGTATEVDLRVLLDRMTEFRGDDALAAALAAAAWLCDQDIIEARTVDDGVGYSLKDAVLARRGLVALASPSMAHPGAATIGQVVTRLVRNVSGEPPRAVATQLVALTVAALCLPEARQAAG